MQIEGQIRMATPDDCEAIVALHVAGWRSAYSPALATDWLREKVVDDRRQIWRERVTYPEAGQRVLVAHDESGLLGFGCVYLAADTEWGSMLDSLHVRSDVRGRGVGTRLLHASAELCLDEAPGRRLHLCVLHANPRARTFYRRHGARNGGALVWRAPEGSRVPVWRYYWLDDELPLPARRWDRANVNAGLRRLDASPET